MYNFVGKSLGRYHVVEQLGEGGMATVFKAFDSSLERYVAIKVIRTEKGVDEEFLKRFQREAKALAQLDHPYILKVLDYGEQDGIPYLVMPFIPGGTLKQRLGHPWPYQEAAKLLAPVARALEYAHQQHIIHRDVKPANILITQPGAPILSDFGIAKMLDKSEATQLTGTGVGIGTPDYMAPEQWLGTADARTDIYALGVVLYEMVTGRRPYVADTPAAVLLKHMQEPLPRPKDFIHDLPDEIEGVLFKAMAKNPEDRYQDMGAMATALEQLAALPAARPSTDRLPTAAPTMRPYAAVRPAPAAGVQASAVAAPAVPKRGPSGWAIAGIGLALAAFLLVCLGGLALLLLRQKPPALSGAETPPVFTPTSPGMLAVPPPDQSAIGTPPGEATEIPPTEQPLKATKTAFPDLQATKPPITSAAGLPEDIPLLQDNNGDLITQTSADMTLFMFSTNLDFKKVEQFYRQGMEKEGWKLANTTTLEAQNMLMLTYSKDDREVSINLIYDADSGSTWVQISIIPKS